MDVGPSAMREEQTGKGARSRLFRRAAAGTGNEA